MYSGALFIKQAIGWNLYVSIALLLVMTVVSTLAGRWITLKMCLKII